MEFFGLKAAGDRRDATGVRVAAVCPHFKKGEKGRKVEHGVHFKRSFRRYSS